MAATQLAKHADESAPARLVERMHVEEPRKHHARQHSSRYARPIIVGGRASMKLSPCDVAK